MSDNERNRADDVALPAPEFSKIVSLGNLPEDGQSFSLSPDDEICTKLAQRMDVSHIRDFICVGKIRAGADKIYLTGNIKAILGRVCVASLEPFDEALDEDYDVTFLRFEPKEQSDDEAAAAPDALLEVSEGETFDIGEFAVQQACLAMAAFPRKPGAGSLVERFGKEELSSPFAILKKEQDQ